MLCRDVRCKPESKEGLAEAVPLLKHKMRNGVGFLRAQIGPDVLQVTVMSISDVTPAFVERLTPRILRRGDWNAWVS